MSLSTVSKDISCMPCWCCFCCFSDLPSCSGDPSADSPPLSSSLLAAQITAQLARISMGIDGYKCFMVLPPRGLSSATAAADVKPNAMRGLTWLRVSSTNLSLFAWLPLGYNNLQHLPHFVSLCCVLLASQMRDITHPPEVWSDLCDLFLRNKPDVRPSLTASREVDSLSNGGKLMEVSLGGEIQSVSSNVLISLILFVTVFSLLLYPQNSAVLVKYICIYLH